MNSTMIFVLVLLAVPLSLAIRSHAKRLWKIRHATDHQYVFQPSVEATFEERLKAARMKPDKMVVCGPNAFAYDRKKGKVLVQSLKTPECVLLRCQDILAYTLLCDGRIKAERGRDVGEGIAAASLSSDCETIELRIETLHRDYPSITLPLMPFRFEHKEIRNSALGTAREIAEVLDEALNR